MHPFTCELSASCVGQIALFQLIMNSVRYFPIAGAVFLIFWVWKKVDWEHFQIQGKFPGQIWHEIRWSFLTLVIFVAMGSFSIISHKVGWSRVYLDINKYGVPYLFFSFFLLIVWHETWFYWKHRLVHLRLLFKPVHLVHHRSVNPSPFAGYSFSLFEAFLEGAYLLIFVFVVPVHPIVALSQAGYAMIMNIMFHSGYEFYPSGFTKGLITRWFNTSTHHNMHHSNVNCNYGLYFNFWDRIMGTNHPKYDEYFEAVVSRRESRGTVPLQFLDPSGACDF